MHKKIPGSKNKKNNNKIGFQRFTHTHTQRLADNPQQIPPFPYLQLFAVFVCNTEVGMRVREDSVTHFYGLHRV